MKGLWGKFRSWPKAVQIVVGVFLGLIGVGAVTSGSAEDKKTLDTTSTTVAITATSGTTASTVASTTTAPPVVTTATTAPAVTSTTVTPTTKAPTTTTTRGVTTTTRAPTTITKAPPTTVTTSVYYANCDAVRAAGKAPLHRGQPGYRSGLDRDGDGTACDTEAG